MYSVCPNNVKGSLVFYRCTCISVLHIYITNIYVNTHLHIWNTDTREEKNHNKKRKRIIYIYWEEFKPCEL